MKTARKFILPAIIFCLTLAITLFGLGFLFQTDQKPEPIFLKVVGFWDPKIFNTLKKQFQEQNPRITIEYEQKDPKRYYPNLKSDLATSKTTPDVFWWHSGWGPALEKNLDSLPPEIMDSATYEKTYYPVTKTDMVEKGTYRGLPLEIDGLALLYNKAIFASSNFSETPKTWTTLREKYVPLLTLRNEKQIFTSAIALGSVVNVENFPEIVGLFLLQNGVVFTDKGALTLYGQTAAAKTAASEAFKFFYLFSKIDKTWDSTLPNSIEAFAKGKVAMILLPANKIDDLQALIKKENLKVDFGVAPTPQLPGNQPVSWASYWALGVSSKSVEKAASWKLVKFLNSPQSLRTVFKMENAMSQLGRAYPQMDMAKEQTTNPYLAAYLTQAPSAKSWYLNSDTFDSGLNDSVIAEFKKSLARIENGEDAPEALKKLVPTLSPILKKYGIVTK